MDNVDCGMAGRMNADRLGLAVAWADQSRDMLQFLDYYMPLQQLRPGQTDAPRRQTSKYLSYPTELPRQKRGIARKRRKVVGVGHSFSQYISGLTLSANANHHIPAQTALE